MTYVQQAAPICESKVFQKYFIIDSEIKESSLHPKIDDL